MTLHPTFSSFPPGPPCLYPPMPCALDWPEHGPSEVGLPSHPLRDQPGSRGRTSWSSMADQPRFSGPGYNGYLPCRLVGGKEGSITILVPPATSLPHPIIRVNTQGHCPIRKCQGKVLALPWWRLPLPPEHTQLWGRFLRPRGGHMPSLQTQLWSLCWSLCWALGRHMSKT